MITIPTQEQQKEITDALFYPAYGCKNISFDFEEDENDTFFCLSGTYDLDDNVPVHQNDVDDFDYEHVSIHETIEVHGYLNDYDTYEQFRTYCISAFTSRYKHVTRI